MLANRSHVRYEFTNTKKLANKLAGIEASSICRQQFANLFADCFCAVHTHQLEFANTSLPTLVCRVKAALVLASPIAKPFSQLNSFFIATGFPKTKKTKQNNTVQQNKVLQLPIQMLLTWNIIHRVARQMLPCKQCKTAQNFKTTPPPPLFN